MDKRDILLSQLLQTNSRLSYNELASKLGISINAVHKRIKEMMDAGIICGFRARLSVLAVGALTVWVFGRSKAPSSSNLQVKLHENDSTYWVAFGSGDFVYVGAYLRDFSQLEQYASFVQKEAQLLDPTIGIMPQPTLPQGTKRLYSIDYQIICALHKDCRRSLSDVAEELHISPKTVRRRLAKMISEGLVELSIEWYPDVSNDILTMFHLRLRAMADKTKIINILSEEIRAEHTFLSALR